MVGLAEQKVVNYLDKINKENSKVNAILHINDKAIEEARAIDEKVSKTGKKGNLYGYVIAVKSNINVKGLICNCASHVLENYIAPYDASVISKIKAEDGIIIGMTNMDEFAAGGSGKNSAFGCALNPSAPQRVPGGSSSGSASAVAAGFCDVALGSDTGGSIRNPASNCGIIGIKPSYGLVSRYGLIDLSMSLDQIGTISKDIDSASKVLEVIRGIDDKDSKTFDSKKIEIKTLEKVNLGILKIKGVDKRIQELVDKKVNEFSKKYTSKQKEVEIEHVELAVQTYYPLVYVEFFSGTRKFDGRRFGKKIEEYCGKEVLRRILGGKEITKAEYGGRNYNKALKIKEIIKDEFEDVFEKVDCVILPTVPKLPWKLSEATNLSAEEEYAFDACTIPANLAEICAISIPIGKINEGNEEIPVGMQIYCAKSEESKMLSIAKMFESLI